MIAHAGESHLNPRLHQAPGYRIEPSGCPSATEIRLWHQAKDIELCLSQSAALVWSLCDGQRTLNEIEMLLADAYASDAETAEAIAADVERASETLIAHGALEWLSSEGYDIPILLYHKVAEAPPPGNTVWISRDMFAAQMAALSERGYVTVSLRDYLAYRAGLATPPPRPVILTFDDGYADVEREVRPILETYGFTATVFLVTQAIGARQRMDNSWDPPEAHYGVEMLLWSEVESLSRMGYELGSHTLTHPRLSAVGLDQAKRELTQSAAALHARLGEPPVAFAYPFGDGAGVPRIEALVQQTGYRVAVSTRPGIANTLTSDLWALPRVKITEADSPTDDDGFIARLSPFRSWVGVC